MQVGDSITYQAEPGQAFANGATTAKATVQSIEQDRAHVLVMPEGGEPFLACVSDSAR